jgi:hypothetical protein
MSKKKASPADLEQPASSAAYHSRQHEISTMDEPSPLSSGSETSNKLCQHCAEIDLDRVFSPDPELIALKWTLWGEAGARHPHPVPGCRLCDFFGECIKVSLGRASDSVVSRGNDQDVVRSSQPDWHHVPCLQFTMGKDDPTTLFAVTVFDRNNSNSRLWGRHRPFIRPTDRYAASFNRMAHDRDMVGELYRYQSQALSRR